MGLWPHFDDLEDENPHKPPVRLIDLIAAEIVDYRQARNCPNPQCLTYASPNRTERDVYPRLEAVPDMLCIIPFRFQYRPHPDPELAMAGQVQSYKIDRPVTFGPSIDLSRFTVHKEKLSAYYKLYAVLKHRGGTNSGHWKPWVQNRGKWWEINDGILMRTRATAAREQVMETPGAAAAPAWGKNAKKTRKPAKKGRKLRANEIFTPCIMFYERAHPSGYTA